MPLFRLNRTGALQVLFLGLASTLAACAAGPGPGGAGADSTQGNRRLPCVLVLENEGISDLHIYAIRGETSRIRLGTVGSLEQRRVRLPQALMSARYINLLAVPAAAGEAYMSDRVYLEEGTEVVWRLRNDLVFSSLFLRSGG